MSLGREGFGQEEYLTTGLLTSWTGTVIVATCTDRYIVVDRLIASDTVANRYSFRKGNTQMGPRMSVPSDDTLDIDDLDLRAPLNTCVKLDRWVTAGNGDVYVRYHTVRGKIHRGGS